MWYADLSPCTSFPPFEGNLLAVGWLERRREYRRRQGPPTHSLQSVWESLKLMSKDPWTPVAFGGSHGCDLCCFEAEARGISNIFIPGDGVVYVCPGLIAHYMNVHEYEPPEVFCRAVLDCPPMGTMDYLKAIRAGGLRYRNGHPI